MGQNQSKITRTDKTLKGHCIKRKKDLVFSGRKHWELCSSITQFSQIG